MLTLVIKGDITAAYKAADAHMVELTSITERCGSDECIASAPRHCLFNVMRWFIAEQENAPFPAGTLLFYNSPE